MLRKFYVKGLAFRASGLADGFGLPVSTTNVLSSGVADTMAANGLGLQSATIKNMALAWILTLPAAMLIAESPSPREHSPPQNGSPKDGGDFTVRGIARKNQAVPCRTA
jgi:Phosphate transporter family